jgi:hypothetical protein
MLNVPVTGDSFIIIWDTAQLENRVGTGRKIRAGLKIRSELRSGVLSQAVLPKHSSGRVLSYFHFPLSEEAVYIKRAASAQQARSKRAASAQQARSKRAASAQQVGTDRDCAAGADRAVGEVWVRWVDARSNPPIHGTFAVDRRLARRRGARE